MEPMITITRRTAPAFFKRAAPATFTHRYSSLSAAQKLTHIYATNPPSSKDNNPDDWDRSIKEAIEDAKREQPTTKDQQQNTPAPPDPQKQNNNNDDNDEYIYNIGRVTMALPHELEGYFSHGLTSSLYTPSVQLIEASHTNLELSGKRQYMGFSRILRLALIAYFSDPTLTILQMRQLHQSANDDSAAKPDNNELGGGWEGPHPEEHGLPDKGSSDDNDPEFAISVRWVFEGSPRYTRIFGGNVSRFEGEFRYLLDRKSGLIAVHKVSSIHPAPSAGLFVGPNLGRWVGWFAPRGSLSLSKQETRE